MFLAIRFNAGYNYVGQCNGPVCLAFAEKAFGIRTSNFHFNSGGRNLAVSVFNLEEIQEEFCALPQCAFPLAEFAVAALTATVWHGQFATHERRKNVLAREVRFRSAENARHSLTFS